MRCQARSFLAKSMIMRLLKFNVVGCVGIAVQAGALAFFMRVAGIQYLVATFLAVETAVLHNYFWHRRWTWADRPRSHLELVRFNLTTGAVSIVGNMFFTWLLVASAGLDAQMANLGAIAGCSLLNFVISDRFVFSRTPFRPAFCGRIS